MFLSEYRVRSKVRNAAIWSDSSYIIQALDYVANALKISKFKNNYLVIKGKNDSIKESLQKSKYMVDKVIKYRKLLFKVKIKEEM